MRFVSFSLYRSRERFSFENVQGYLKKNMEISMAESQLPYSLYPCTVLVV